MGKKVKSIEEAFEALDVIVEQLESGEASLEEAFFGVEKEIKIPSTKVCEACHGHGTADGKEPEICPDCHGSGKIRRYSCSQRLDSKGECAVGKSFVGNH